MKKSILTLIFIALAFMASAQTKKVAILETVDKEGNVPYAVRLMLRTNLTYAISNTTGYEGYDRVDVSQIMGEQDFQRTGMVNDEQIRRLGEMTGCSSILVAEAVLYDNSHIIVTAKILNVETASVENSAPPQIASTSPEELQEACRQLAFKLIGVQDVSNTITAPKVVVDNNKPSAPAAPVSTTATIQGQGTDIITITIGDVSFDMIKVSVDPEGVDPKDKKKKEVNQLRLIIAEDYYIGKFEVTQEVWEAVTGENPSLNKGNKLPVDNVSQDMINDDFLPKLNKMTGMKFRLPSEAEWEFAARGGNNSRGYKFSGGDGGNLDKVAWYFAAKHPFRAPFPVGKLQPNELGIYDMSGNVSEWCNVKGVSRGGSWAEIYQFCDVSASNRSETYLEKRLRFTGFRVVLVP